MGYSTPKLDLRRGFSFCPHNGRFLYVTPGFSTIAMAVCWCLRWHGPLGARSPTGALPPPVVTGNPMCYSGRGSLPRPRPPGYPRRPLAPPVPQRS